MPINLNQLNDLALILLCRNPQTNPKIKPEIWAALPILIPKKRTNKAKYKPYQQHREKAFW